MMTSNVVSSPSEKNLSSGPSMSSGLGKLKYPEVSRLNVRNSMHGVEIRNPYQYLEDPNREETRNFVEKQNELFTSFISSNSPSRDEINEKLNKEWNVPYKGIPMKYGSRVFHWENPGGTLSHNVLYVEELSGSLEEEEDEGKVSEPRKLIDLNRWDVKHQYSINNVAFSNDGKYVAYARSEKGSDWETIKIRDANCGHDLEDVLDQCKFSNIKWTKDSKGFFYQKFVPLVSDEPSPTEKVTPTTQSKLYYHDLGTRQDEDVVVVEFPNHPTWTMFPEISDDGNYLFIHASDVIGEKYLFVTNLLVNGVTENMKLTNVFSAPGDHWYLANDGPVFYLMTTVGARNFHHVVRVQLSSEGRGKHEVVVPDQGKKVHWATVVNQNKLVICYVKGDSLCCQLEIRDLSTGKLLVEHNEQLNSIELGTFTERFGKRTQDELHFLVESYTNPGTIYRLEFNGEEGIASTIEVIHRTAVPTLNMEDFTFTMQTFSSDDGTTIPICLIHKRDLVRDSALPTILTAYGGYGYTRLPVFNFPYLFFAQHFNGVVAVANIRGELCNVKKVSFGTGGGEFGKSWWNQGRLLNKKNGFQDFIGAAQFLFNNGYTRAEKLAITGASNGGLLIGAVVNQRPDLFGCAIPQVGILDMLSFSKYTVGHLWIGEFGNPEDSTHFHNLFEYSPLHNIRMPENVQYPSILVTTAEKDDRVVPSHSYKYAAQLQYMATKNPRQKNPFLLKVYPNSGHFSEKPTKIEEWTDILSFLEATLDLQFLDCEA